MAAQLLFFFLALVAVLAALGMLMARNPVTSALWLVLNLFCVAGLYLTLNAQFIAVVQVLVYAGAIMVLFLFVIMLLNLASAPRLRDVHWGMGVTFLLGVVLLTVIVYVVAVGVGALPEAATLRSAAQNGSATELAKEMFTTYLLPLELVGILLLAATIGAVMLAKKHFA